MVAAFMAIDGRAAEEHGHMAKILVIDDDFIVRMTIVRLLEEAGHQVTELRSREDLPLGC
jgi:CheY-like chemotaxis protein